MIIVAHRIRVGQGFQIRRVAALNVVEAHRGRALASRFWGERYRRRLAVGAGADRNFDPGEEIGETTRRVARRSGLDGRRSGLDAAIKLLPHLEETMHRARIVGVVGVFWPGDLERARRETAGVLSIVFDSLVRGAGGLTRAAGQ